MISSPCKNCQRSDKSKEDCIDECDIIQAVQRNIITQGQHLSTAIGHSDTERLRVLIKPESTRILCSHLLR